MIEPSLSESMSFDHVLDTRADMSSLLYERGLQGRVLIVGNGCERFADELWDAGYTGSVGFANLSLEERVVDTGNIGSSGLAYPSIEGGRGYAGHADAERFDNKTGEYDAVYLCAPLMHTQQGWIKEMEVWERRLVNHGEFRTVVVGNLSRVRELTESAPHHD